jgi:uncharacterized repeat protein (TIGR01451 family)
VSKTGPATITAGTSATYTITLTNKGPSDAATVALTDALPAGETLVSETQVSGPDVFTNTSAGNTASFSATTMGAGNTDTFKVVAFAASSLTSGAPVTDTASVSAVTSDPDLTNNSSSVTSTVATSADLAVTKTGPATITAATTVTYTITLNNLGPSDAATVALTDTLPSGETLVSESQTSGPDVFTNTSAGNTASFSATTMGAGHTDTFAVIIRAGSGLQNGSTLSDTATVTSVTPDVNPANNTSTFTSATAAVPVVIVPTTLKITGATDHFGLFGMKEVVTVTVTAANGATVNEGSVTLNDGGKSQTVSVSNGTATATFKFSLFQEFMVALQHTITGDYSDPMPIFGSSSTSFTAPGNFFGFLFQLAIDQALLTGFTGGSAAQGG